MFPSLVSILLQDRPWYPEYFEVRLRSHQTEDHLHLFGTISAPDLLRVCKTRKDLGQQIKERDEALGLTMGPDGEGIVGPYDDDDRETLMQFTDWIRTITLHRNAKLVMPKDPVQEYIQPYGVELSVREGRRRVVLDIVKLEVDDDTRETLDACSWLLQSDQWEAPELERSPVTVQCSWDMLRPLLQTVCGPSDSPMRQR